MYVIDGTGRYVPVSGYQWASNGLGIAVYDDLGNYYPNVGAPGNAYASGVTYTFQDGWVGSRYVGYSGQVWAWLDLPPSQLPFYLKADMNHTWNTGSITGIEISWPLSTSPTLKVTFGTVPGNWTAFNQTTVTNWPAR